MNRDYFAIVTCGKCKAKMFGASKSLKSKLVNHLRHFHGLSIDEIKAIISDFFLPLDAGDFPENGMNFQRKDVITDKTS